MIIKRDTYLNKLIRNKHNGFIKIISGVRRCGKSYLLFELFKNHLNEQGTPDSHIISIQLDDRQYIALKDPDACYNYIKSRIQDENMHYLLLDEVQMMSDFESVLNGLLHIKNLDIYVTGSNSKFLSSDIVTEFRGRGYEICLYPLNFSEYYSAFDGDWSRAWYEFCFYGGMPAVLSFQDDSDKAHYLQNLFKETYIKDIIERNGIRNKTEFEILLDIMASNIGCLTSVKKLANAFNSTTKSSITESTLAQYLEYMSEAFLIHQVRRYDIKGKKYLSSPSKYYFVDPGLRNARLNFRQFEMNHIMENVIYNELLVRGYQVDVGNVGIREKDNEQYVRKQLEVDFVANQGSKRYYIQSAMEMPSQDKLEQEEKSLLNIGDSFKKIIVVEKDIVPNYDENGILIIGLKDFLLKTNSLEL